MPCVDQQLKLCTLDWRALLRRLSGNMHSHPASIMFCHNVLQVPGGLLRQVLPPQVRKEGPGRERILVSNATCMAYVLLPQHSV